MDPNATLRAIGEAEPEDVPELCEALRGWLLRHGFAPDWTHYPVATRIYRDWLEVRYA